MNKSTEILDAELNLKYICESYGFTLKEFDPKMLEDPNLVLEYPDLCSAWIAKTNILMK